MIVNALIEIVLCTTMFKVNHLKCRIISILMQTKNKYRNMKYHVKIEIYAFPTQVVCLWWNLRFVDLLNLHQMFISNKHEWEAKEVAMKEASEEICIGTECECV